MLVATLILLAREVLEQAPTEVASTARGIGREATDQYGVLTMGSSCTINITALCHSCAQQYIVRGWATPRAREVRQNAGPWSGLRSSITQLGEA